MGVSLRRTMRLRRSVQVFMAGLLAALLLAVFVPSPKAEAAAIMPYNDNAMFVDSTSTHSPGSVGSTYLWPTTGDFTVEVWATYEGPWANNILYTLWQSNGYYLYAKNGNFWFHANDGSETDTQVKVPTGWFHTAIVGSPTTKTVRLVLNGVSTSWSKTYSTFTYTKTFGLLGNSSASNSTWFGQLDQFKTFNTALTDSQIAQSMNLYSNVGITGSPAIYALYDMNYGDGGNAMNVKAGTFTQFMGAESSAFNFKDVKAIDTTSRPGYTIYSFPRTYLPSEGGWKAPASASASKYEYLVVAGGGGGGGNRGGGGGAGGLITGQVAMPFNGVFKIVVGQGGYSGANGTDSIISNTKATGSILSATGGGAGGTHLGTNIDGSSGGSGGGASLCYASAPANAIGGSGTSGQGNAGASNDSTNCAIATPDNRHTGGGGGSGSAGEQGSGGSTAPTAATTPMTRPNGGAGTVSSITGTAIIYAAGGGGAIGLQSVGEGYVTSYQGLGGSGIGGDGAGVASRGANATVNTGSGGGGGGYNASSTLAPATGGYGSAGVVILVAPNTAYLSTPAAGATLTGPVIVQPTVTVPTGVAEITSCSVYDVNGSSVGVSVTCTPVTGSGNTATLTDLTFTSGTPLQYYTVVFSVTGYDDIQEEMYLAYQPASVTVASTGATSNFVWDGSTLMATSAGQAITVLTTDVSAHINQDNAVITASGAISMVNSFTSTTPGNGVLFKGLTYSQSLGAILTTANGPVTLWSTNSNAPTGSAGVTAIGVSNNAQINTTGGSIVIGGGANPLTSPATGEIGFSLAGKLQAAGGNISIRADSVLNSSLNTANHQLLGINLTAATISTTGSGTITIVANSTGSANGFIGDAIYWNGSGAISTVNGNISITAINSGSGNTNGMYVNNSGGAPKITSSGSGSITILGDARGTTATSGTSAPNAKVYGLCFNGAYSDVTTVDGNISLTGYAPNIAASSLTGSIDTIGVYSNASVISSTGLGSVSIYGQGGDIGNTVTGKPASSMGVSNASAISTTSTNISIQGLGGAVTGIAGYSYGYVSVLNTSYSNQLSATVITTTGNITVSGDTLPTTNTSAGVTGRGIYTQGAKVKSNSGNVSLTGNACSTCSSTEVTSGAYGVQLTSLSSNASYNDYSTGGSGTLTITGNAVNERATSGTTYGVYIAQDSATRSSISTTDGALTITGTTSGSANAKGVYLTTGYLTTGGGNLTITATLNNPGNANSGQGVYASSFPMKTGAGNIAITADVNSTAGFNGSGIALYSTNLTTTTGNISADAEINSATSLSGANGLILESTTVSSGDSATSTTGGTINLRGVIPAFATGTQTNMSMYNSTVDSYNAAVTILAGQQTSTSNSSRAGLNLTGTENIGATSASVDVTVYGNPDGYSLYQGNAQVLNLGGANSNANFTFNVDAWHKQQVTTLPTTSLDTTGSFTLQPLGTSLGPDMFNSNVGITDPMKLNVVPTTRVTSFTVGKPGNLRPITFSNAVNINPTSGVIKVYGGKFASSAQVSANTLAVDSSGTVTLSNAANSFNEVAVKAASATGFNLVNTAASWAAGTFSGISGNYGVPSMLKASGSPPSSVQLGSALATYSVVATDALGFTIPAEDTRSADALSVTASIKTGATTTLGGTTSQTGTAGAAIAFSDLSFTNPGVHTLAFDAANYTQYVSPNITVSGGTPTLSLSYFSSSNATDFATATTTASPTFTSNNTSSPSYSSLTTSVCTVVSNTGVITTKTPGTCTIQVDQVADATYLAGTQTVNITINKKSQTALTITSTSGSFGEVLTLATTGGNAGSVTYAIDSGTCTLASSTTLNLGAVGSTCMVTATRAGDATYASVSSVSTSIATNKGTQAGLVTPSGITISYLSAGLDLATLTYSGGSGGGAIGFSTSTTGCSINGTVLTSTNQVGGTSCSISAVKAGDDSYNTGSPSVFSVAIAKANQAAITVTSTSATYGQGLSLTYSGGSSTGAVSFSVVSGSCTIAGTTLTPTAATSCVIKVTKALDTNYNVVSSADTTVNIAKGTQAALTISSTSGAFGSVLTLTTSGGTDNGAVTYVVDSGTCSLATASTLNLGAVGDLCMVTATKAATANYEAISSTSTSIATVRANQATLVAPSGVTLTYGDTNGLDLTTVTFTGGSGTGSISFSTATNGCSIASNVLTSTNDAATTCVVASTKAGDSSYNTGTAVNLTVTIAKANQAPLVISTTVGTYATPLTLSTTGGTDNGAVTYAKDSGTCTLASGVLTLGNAATTCYITATKAATTNYNAVSSISTSIITNKATQATLVITSTSGTYNTALNLTTSGGTDTGAVTYAVDSGTCVVNGSTLTLGNAGDSCFVTATKATTTNYLVAVSVSTSISTGRATQAALVAPTGTNLTYGDTTGINLTALSFSGGSGTGSLIFSTTTSGCAISGSNVLTSTNNAATTCVVATNKAGDNNFSAGSSVNLTVTIVKANQSTLTVTSTSATYPVALSLTTSGGDGDGAVTFSVVSGACTISSATLTPTGATSCVIRATKATSTNFNATTSADATVTIAKGTQTSVTITSASTFAYAGTLTLTSSGGSSGATGYVYATSTTGCSITNGVLSSTLGATNTCAITSYKAGDANWNDSTTVSQTVTIVKANQATIMSVPTGVTITYNNQNGLDLTTLAITGGDGTGAYQYTATTAGCNIASNVLTTANLANTSCLIDVVKAADANYNASPVGVLSVAIVTANQPAIVVTTTAATFGQTLVVQYTGGIGTGAVTYSATGTCSVDASGVLSVTAAGATGCSVTVSKAAEANKYNSATSVATTVAVAKGTQAAVSFTSGTTIQYSASLILTASGGSSTANGYVFSTSTTNCAVSGATLTSTLPATNSCAVSVYKVGDSNWNDSAAATATITIAKANQAALVVPTTTNLTYGDTSGINLGGLTITGGSGTGLISFASGTAGCSVATATLTSTNNAGTTCTVVTTKAGDANYNTSTSVNLIVTIVKASQAALVAPVGVTLTYANSAGLDLTSLTFTGGSGTGSLSFSTATTGCSITNNVLTSTNNASTACNVATVKATDTNYNVGSSVNLQVNITRANQAPVVITTTSGTYGQTLSLAATGGNDSGAISFSVDSGTCSLSGLVLTLGDAASACMVTATKAASNNYNVAYSASTAITTNKAAQAALTITSTSGTYGQSLALTTSGGTDTGAVTFTVNSGTCSVNGSTLTLGDAASSCFVTATKATTTNYYAVSSLSTSITTAKANQAAINVTSLAATYGSNLSLTSTGGTSNGAVSFTKVSGSCTIAGAVLTPTGAGNCVITATMAGGNNYNDVTSANATVLIAKANQSPLAFSMATSVPYLGSLTLTTTGGSGTGNVVFTATAGSACNVTSATLSPSTVGSTCEVLATKLGDANYNSVDATSQVITTTPIAQASITFSNAAVMTYGQTLTLNANGGSGTGAISYSVNNAGTTGCSLSGAVVSVTASGTCVVSAVKAASTNYIVSTTVYQSITVNKAVQTITFTSTMPASPMVGNTYAVSAISTSGAPVVFSTPSLVCTVSGSTVTFVATGNCRVDANAATTTQYQPAATANQTINIGQRNQTLTFDAATLAVTTKTFGDPAFAIAATSSVAGLAPVYSRGAATTNNACLVSTSGLVTIVAVGVCQVQADQAGDANTAAANPATSNFNVVADTANAPTIVSVSAGDQSITAAFVKPSYTGGAVITGYQLVATHAGGQVTYTGCQVVAGNDQSCTIGGLTNGTPYTVKVAAINSAGTGLQSAASAARVPATNPAAVTAFTAVPDNTTLKLAWGLPVSLGGGVFDSYRIFIKPSADANYPTTYTTVNSQSIFDYTFTNLVNGQAYDAMIVTVTTANTLSLVSNTAEVRETPRTVPDAPASILIFEVGSNLVISWTSPVSDGGNAITEYAATIGGTPCVLATPTDTTCSITTPTTPGDYPIEVKAKNAAGLGEAVTGRFTKAAAPVPVVAPPSNGGTEFVANPRIPMLVLGLSTSKISTAGGQILTLQTKNMDKLTEVTVEGVKVKILSMSTTQVRLLMPKHAAGPVTIKFVSPNGTLDLVAVSYVARINASSSGKVTIKNYIQENSVLSAAAKASLRKALAASPNVTAVTCIGYQSWSYDRPLDAQTAQQRAQVACNYLKSIKKSLVVKTAVARTTLEGPASRKLEVLFREGN